MSACYDNIRYSLSDTDGEMRFVSFDVVGLPACRAVASRVRDYVVGRRLRDIDVQRIRSFACPGCEECVLEVIETIRESRRMFVRSSRPMSSMPARPERLLKGRR
jgi:hypothetical protein